MSNKNNRLAVNANPAGALIECVLIGVDHMRAAYYRQCMQIAARCGGPADDSNGTRTAFLGSNG